MFEEHGWVRMAPATQRQAKHKSTQNSQHKQSLSRGTKVGDGVRMEMALTGRHRLRAAAAPTQRGLETPRTAPGIASWLTAMGSALTLNSCSTTALLPLAAALWSAAVS